MPGRSIPHSGIERGPAPQLSGGQVTGRLHFVPDAPGAEVLVGVAIDGGKPVGVAIEASAQGVAIEAVERYDATRSLGHVTLDGAAATVLDAPEETLSGAWYLAQSLIAAESLGSVETALDISVAYAKDRFTFGRAIGSYQAVKHSLTEVLRNLENGRSLLYYAGWARNGAPGEFPLAASAMRSVAGRALDGAARTMISVHGGIGATWEHDAPLYFRRAQLSRRLLGGTARRERPRGGGAARPGIGLGCAAAGRPRTSRGPVAGLLDPAAGPTTSGGVRPGGGARRRRRPLPLPAATAPAPRRRPATASTRRCCTPQLMQKPRCDQPIARAST